MFSGTLFSNMCLSTEPRYQAPDETIRVFLCGENRHVSLVTISQQETTRIQLKAGHYKIKLETLKKQNSNKKGLTDFKLATTERNV